MKTMEMAAVTQYILKAAQSFGSQDNYKKSRTTILGLLVYYSAKTSGQRQDELSYVPKKILTWMLKAAWGGLTETVGDRVTTVTFIHSILFFSVSFSQSLVFSDRLSSKA